MSRYFWSNKRKAVRAIPSEVAKLAIAGLLILSSAPGCNSEPEKEGELAQAAEAVVAAPARIGGLPEDTVSTMAPAINRAKKPTVAADRPRMATPAERQAIEERLSAQATNASNVTQH